MLAPKVQMRTDEILLTRPYGHLQGRFLVFYTCHVHQKSEFVYTSSGGSTFCECVDFRLFVHIYIYMYLGELPLSPYPPLPVTFLPYPSLLYPPPSPGPASPLPFSFPPLPFVPTATQPRSERSTARTREGAARRGMARAKRTRQSQDKGT